MFFEPIYMPRALNTGTCRPTQEKIGRGCGKNAGEWTGRVEISKEELPRSKHSMYGYKLTYSRLERENFFKLCVLTRWDFNFCVRSSPLQQHQMSALY